MQIDGYTIKQELGKGGMATVYLAVQESFDREVALKVMSPALVADSTFAERFLREARIVAHLAHPHIVSVYDVGVSHNNYFLAMELHTGGDLTDKIIQRIGPPEAVEILRQIAGALDYAHANGYVHRDIKPGNILFSQHGQAILTDFGIAKAADASTQLTQVQRVVGKNEMTKAGSIVGTPSYMSPEQARGHAVDGRADIYSLGIVLYELLTGHVPYQAQDQIAVAIMHINEPVPVLPDSCAHFQPLLSRMLAKDPDARPQTGAELAEALEELERSGLADTATMDAAGTLLISPEESGFRERPSRSRLMLGVGAGVLAAAAIATFALVDSSPEAGTGDTAALETPAAVTESERSGSAEAAGDGQRVGDATDVRVARLLAAAEIAIAENRLSSPADDNALAKYSEVLALDPVNRPATDGKVRVADRYLELATAAVKRGNYRGARRFVDKVAEFAPAHVELAGVEKLVAQAEAKVRDGPTAGMKSELKIMGLLGSARTALANDQLTNPAGKSAYDKYKQVLAIDPNHPQALEGIQRVGGRYLELASASLGKQNFSAAEEYLEKAETISPGHPRLAKVQSAVAKAQSAGAEATAATN
jgi:serine/threonine-protein kinase PpkA